MDRHSSSHRVQRYVILLLAIVGLVAAWRYGSVSNDAPLYSTSTGLPIFRSSDGLPIFGDPANCGCCGGGGGEIVGYEVALSGITACTFCQYGGWGGDFYWTPVSAPSGVFALTYDEVNRRYVANVTWSYNRFASAGCVGAPTLITGASQIRLTRVYDTWHLEVWGEWPNFPAGPGVGVFYATSQADVDAEWTANNNYSSPAACTISPPQGTIAFYGGSASVRPIWE